MRGIPPMQAAAVWRVITNVAGEGGALEAGGGAWKEGKVVDESRREAKKRIRRSMLDSSLHARSS